MPGNGQPKQFTTNSDAYYRNVSHTKCDSSGKINLSIANCTASGEPGIEKTSTWRPPETTIPAVARDKIAPDPID